MRKREGTASAQVQIFNELWGIQTAAENIMKTGPILANFRSNQSNYTQDEDGDYN